MNESIRKRRAVRAILLTTEHQALLIQSKEPQSGRSLWALPGGGIETGESVEDGLRREVQEETGLQRFVLGPHGWNREHTFSWDGMMIFQQEAYYLIQVQQFGRRWRPTLNRLN